MKSFSDYTGSVPEGVQVVKEGRLTRIFFDFSKEEKEIDGETVTQLAFETVDVLDATYGKIISAIVRDRYSADDTEAIIANGSDTEAHAAELAEFQTWRAKAKEVAKAVISE